MSNFELRNVAPDTSTTTAMFSAPTNAHTNTLIKTPTSVQTIITSLTSLSFFGSIAFEGFRICCCQYFISFSLRR